MTARQFRLWTVPIVLFAVTFAAYGVFAAQQGFHWDDWGLIGMMSLQGPRALLDYFARARPLWGYFYVATISLFGTNLLAWQVFALLMRGLAAVTLWWSLRLTWPRREGFAFWAAVFALVYPGFSQHSIAVAYSHYSMMLAMFYVSLGLSLLALRGGRRRGVTVITALTLSVLQIFSTEYFFGLELLRPILFWIVIREVELEPRQQWKRTALAYLPYGLVVAAFVIWRGFFFESQLYQVSAQTPVLASLPRQVWDGIWNSSVAAWVGVFRLPSAEMGARLTFVYWLILLAAFAFFIFYPNRLKSDSADGVLDRAPFLQWLGVGFLALLTAGIPFYAASLPVQLKFPDDRFTQPFAFGVSILLAAGLDLLPRSSWRPVGASALVALAVGLQIQNAFNFREDWKAQKAYFWQLAWRVPALKSGTSILSERAPFQFTDDDALTFPTNWMYASKYVETNAIHQVSMSTRLNFQNDTIKFSQPLQGRLFTSDFVVSPEAIIVVQFAQPSCLRVLHPVYDADLPVAPRSRKATESLLGFGLPFLRREEAAALPLSNMGQILPKSDSPARPPEVIFGSEPPHHWCYYFEQADLARSQRNWFEVARLGDKAFSVPYYPNNLAEYLPFIEAYARVGRVKEARKLTMETARQMPVLQSSLCALWQRVAASGALSESDQFLAEQIQSDLGVCPVKGVNE